LIIINIVDVKQKREVKRLELTENIKRVIKTIKLNILMFLQLKKKVKKPNNIKNKKAIWPGYPDIDNKSLKCNGAHSVIDVTNIFCETNENGAVML